MEEWLESSNIFFFFVEVTTKILYKREWRVGEVALKLSDEVKVVDTVIEEIRGEGECVQDALPLLEEVGFKGKVTKIDEDSVYVGFVKGDGWTTLIFDEQELELV